LGSKGSPSVIVAIGAAPVAATAVIQAAKPSGEAASVVQEWIRLALAEKFAEADKLADFPRRSDATHDIRDSKLLAGAKLEQQFTRDLAVLIVSDERQLDEKRGKLFFLLFRSPRHPSGWMIREADFVDQIELEERIAAFAAPVLLGHEIERTLGNDPYHVLDFDSGRMMRLSEDWDRKVDDPLKWIAVRGMDVKIWAHPNKADELTGLALMGNVAEVGNGAWDATAAELEKLLEGKVAMNSTLEPNPGQLLATYAFRTHGHPANQPYIGVLQILQIDQSRQQVRFRYRLVGKSQAVNH
jgi:hypothetical protein